MSQIKYTLDDFYILSNYKINNKNNSESTPKYDVPKINIDPKLRLAALSSISDGSSYFKNRLNQIEQSIDSNKIKLDTIESNELVKLKTYLTQNLESEIIAADKDNDYIINLFNLFIKKEWNQLIEKLLSYTFKLCNETSIEMNISFLQNIYKVGCNTNNSNIKSKISNFLQQKNLSQLLNEPNSDLSHINIDNNEFDIVDQEMSENDVMDLDITNIDSSNNHSGNINITNKSNFNNQSTSNQSITDNQSISNNKSISLHATHIKHIADEFESINITTINNPFLSNTECPLRYIKSMSGLVYLFGIIEVGNVNSMSEQNEKVLFNLSPDCYPKYPINLFVQQQLETMSSFDRNSSNTAHILIKTNGKVIYKSDDVLNWNSNKMKIYFDGSLFYLK